MSTLQVDPTLDAAIRGGLALLFAAAAFHKVRDIERFRTILADYKLLPPAAVFAAAPLVVACEATLSAGLLFSFETSRVVWSIAAAAMLGVYAGAIAVNLYRGRRDLDCGCGFGATFERIGPALLVRNTSLAGFALWASAPLVPRCFVAVDAVTAVAAVAGAALLYAAGERLRALPASGPGGSR